MKASAFGRGHSNCGRNVTPTKISLIEAAELGYYQSFLESP
jgi:hypothetical protein